MPENLEIKLSKQSQALHVASCHPLRANLIREACELILGARSVDGLMKMEGIFFSNARQSDESGVTYSWKMREFRWRQWSRQGVLSFISKVQAQTERRLTMVFLLWAWWSERNNVREGGNRRLASGIAQFIRLCG